MPTKFFPNPVFAWVFCGLLVSFAAVAAYIDTRRAIVPNKLTVSGLVMGLVLNVVRGAWVATIPDGRWSFFDPGGSVWLGGLDGLLVGLVGFVVAFAVFFGMWVLGLCGGGDVKLFAALGGWFGLQRVVAVWVVSVVVLVLWALAKVLMAGVRPSKVQASIKKLQKAEQTARQTARQTAQRGTGRPKLRITYSFPIAVASVLACLWFFKHELMLLPPPPPGPPPATPGTGTNDVPPTSQPTR